MAASVKLVKEATVLDQENKLNDAFLKYLEASASLCLDVIEKCKQGTDNVFSDYANQRLQTLGHCFERAKIVREAAMPKLATTMPPMSPAERCRTLPAPSKARENGGSDPETLAKDINRLLLMKHKDKIATGTFTDDQIAKMEITLQKKMMENLSLAEQKTKISQQPWSPPPSNRRSIARTVSLAKNELAAGIQTMRRSTNFDPNTIQSSRVAASTVEPYVNVVPVDIEVDSDMEASPKLPALADVFVTDGEFSQKEKSRQISILELCHTEKTHVGHLKILCKVFYQPLKKHRILPENFVQFLPCTMLDLVFANLDEILNMHIQINKAFKALYVSKRPIDVVGDTLLKFFDRELGDKYKNAVVKYCEHQSYAMQLIEERKAQDIRFSKFLSEGQSHRLSRNFTLTDWLLKEMQRITKYPLLIERIIKFTDEEEKEEVQKLQRCYECTKDLLEATNNAKRTFDSWKKLTELQLVMDTSKFDNVNHPIVREFRNFDLRNYSLIHDGFLSWKQGHHKVANVHAVLVDNLLILLTKKGNNKLLLKFHGATISTDPVTGNTKMLRYCPIVALRDVDVKDDNNEEGKFLIYEVNAAVPPYELTANSSGEKLLWMNHLTEQIKKKRSVGQSENREPASLVDEMNIAAPKIASQLNDSGVDLPETEDVAGRAKLIRKMRRSDGIIVNTILNKQKMLAELLGTTSDELLDLERALQQNVEGVQVKDVTAAAILQVDSIFEMIAKAEHNKVAESNQSTSFSFNSIPCAELSPCVVMLSKYLSVILASVV